MRNRSSLVVIVLLGSLLMASRGMAQTLTFEGLQNEEAIDTFYDGGAGGFGSTGGPNYGISFGTDALAVIADQDGGNGNFANNPSGDTVAFFLSGAGDVMNDAGGFTTGFSFYYSAINEPGEVDVYSGLNDTGTLLASLDLAVTPEITPAPDGGAEYFDNWQAAGVNFSGVAESVDFTGTANQIGFDNITINSATAGSGSGTVTGVPEINSYGLGSLLLVLAGAVALVEARRDNLARHAASTIESGTIALS
jgi:hypothetical protein